MYSKKQKQHKQKQNKKRVYTTALIPNQLYAQTFPRTSKITMKYTETRAFTTTGSVLTNDYVYNLNSIFDPNRTGTGHQPQGHDIWTGMYNRYRVDSCQVSITFVGSTNGYGTLISMVPNNDATLYSDISTAVESPMAVTKLYAYGAPALKLSKNYDLAEITGVTRSVYNADDRYSAASANNPTEIIVLHVNIAELNYGAVPVSYVISLNYMVTLFDPYQAGQSLTSGDTSSSSKATVGEETFIVTSDDYSELIKLRKSKSGNLKH